MSGDDDIAARLPEPSPPAPARRESAIDAAMRRFDAVHGDQQAAGQVSIPTARPPWWERVGRPQVAALVTAGLIALIGVPAAWLSVSHRAAPATEQYASARDNLATAEVAAPPPMMKMVPAIPANLPPARSTPPTVVEPQPAAPAGLIADAGKDRCAGGDCASTNAPAGAVNLALADAAPPSPAAMPEPPPPPPTAMAASSANISRGSEGQIAKTDEAADMFAVAGGGAPKTEAMQFATAEHRMAAQKPARRGDWNACTVNDPERSLRDCKTMIDPAAPGATGRAAAHVADGLMRAWQGDYDGAITAFDEAIAVSPKLSVAYLNRGLAYQHKGELVRAAADLDRAVHYAPGKARGYYNRSQLLRQQGEAARAGDDEDRAVAIDPDYVAAVK